MFSGLGAWTPGAACRAMMCDAEPWTPVDAACRLVSVGAGKESLNHRVLEHRALRIPYPPPSDPRSQKSCSCASLAAPASRSAGERTERRSAPHRGQRGARAAPARGDDWSPPSRRDSCGRADPKSSGPLSETASSRDQGDVPLSDEVAPCPSPHWSALSSGARLAWSSCALVRHGRPLPVKRPRASRRAPCGAAIIRSVSKPPWCLGKRGRRLRVRAPTRAAPRWPRDAGRRPGGRRRGQPGVATRTPARPPARRA